MLVLVVFNVVLDVHVVDVDAEENWRLRRTVGRDLRCVFDETKGIFRFFLEETAVLPEIDALTNARRRAFECDAQIADRPRI